MSLSIPSKKKSMQPYTPVSLSRFKPLGLEIKSVQVPETGDGCSPQSNSGICKQVFVPEHASQKEKNIHCYLDELHVFFVNVKVMLEDDSRNTTPTQKIQQEFKKLHRSSTFLERRKKITQSLSQAATPLNDQDHKGNLSNGNLSLNPMNFSQALNRSFNKTSKENALLIDDQNENLRSNQESNTFEEEEVVRVCHQYQNQEQDQIAIDISTL